jgi:DNA-binding NarL/FixJ family response regulator
MPRSKRQKVDSVANGEGSGVTHTVLIVEDDPLTRRRLEAVVTSVPSLRWVGSAGNASEAREALNLAPDVLLVDLDLPDGNGIDLIREARATATRTHAMVITVFADEQHVMAAIEAGAQGYLLKDGSADYIGRSIADLLAGGSPISPPIARHLLQRFQTPPPAAAPDEPSLLTAREREILTLVAKGFSVPEISEMLQISEHTVTTHVRHIYRKLEVTSRSQAIYEAVNLGLIDLKN